MMTSQIMSRVEYSIPTYHILALLRHFQKFALFAGFRYDNYGDYSA